MSDSVEMVRALARVVREHDLAELEFYDDDLRIHLVLEPETAALPAAVAVPATPAAAPSPPPPIPPPGPELPTVSSPLAGVFYRAPSPGADPFVNVGDEVLAGQTLCIIEAMKLMNEISADIPCRIREILVVNGDVVDPGEPLFRIEPL